MNLFYICPLWGSENLNFTDFCTNAKSAGYDGVELSLPLDDQEQTDLICQTLRDHELKLVAQHWETVEPNVEEHIVLYRKRLEWLAAANPEFINSQTGRDWFSVEDNQRIIDVAKQVSETTGVKIVHETHRGKFSFCAARTFEFIRANPELRLTADFSHWCNVSESLLEDQQDAVMAAVQRADHIHTRVGHAQGPQVNDPRAPEWKDALDAHLAWWDAIVAERVADGSKQLTITPEFGPVPYMPTMPHTKQPLSDQWDVNVYMMNLLKKRFAEYSE